MIYEKFEKLDDEKHDRIIKSLIGMGRAKFNKLAGAFTTACQAIQQERLLNGEIKQVPSGGPKGYLDTPEKRLFFVLYYLKTYPTFRRAGLPFRLQFRACPRPSGASLADPAAEPVGPRRAAGADAGDARGVRPTR